MYYPLKSEMGVFHFLKTRCRGGMARYHLRRSKERFLRAISPIYSPIYGVFGRDRREMRPFCIAKVLPACPAPTIHKHTQMKWRRHLGAAAVSPPAPSAGKTFSPVSSSKKATSAANEEKPLRSPVRGFSRCARQTPPACASAGHSRSR